MLRIIIAIFVLVPAIADSSHANFIAYYAAEGNANDSSGNAHNGTLVNGSYGPGAIGEAFLMNGSSSYVSVPNSAAFNGSAITVGLWANFSSVSGAPISLLPNVFVGHDEGAGTHNKWVFFYDSTGHLDFHISGSNSAFLSSPGTFTSVVGQWHYYTVTGDGSNYTFYVDGVSLGSVGGPATPAAAAPLTIGQSEGIGFFHGGLDEVRLYDAVLTQAQIQALATVPEPSTMVLMASGMLSLCVFVLRKRGTGGS